MQAAIDRAETLAALRWTNPVEKDVPPPKGVVGFSEGWTCNAHSGRVEPGWSTSVAHGFGPVPVNDRFRSGQQNSCWLYSTKAKAYAAMRHEIEKQSAERLLKCDRAMLEATEDAK